MLLAQKSKPVAVGRKRKRHAIAEFPAQVDQKMEYEEEKKEEDDKEPDSK